jgi:hypothetical protein
MLRRVALVRTGNPEERIASIIMVKGISELTLANVLRLLVTAKVVPSSLILDILMLEELRSSGTSLLTTATRRNNLEDGIH